MLKLTTIITLSLTATLTACAPMSIRQPLVDMKGVNTYAYAEDLQACQAYAQNIANGAGQHAADTAIGTGLAGAVLGGLLGNRNTSLFGLLVGAAEGYNAASRMDEKSVHDVVNKCLQGRGYSVLN